METERASRSSPTIALELTPEALRDLLRSMVQIRAFEERVAELSKLQRIPGFVHLSIGQEAIATGICAALTSRDRLTSTHRGHGHVLAKGCRADRLLAELMGRAEGYSGGKGGSMHVVSLAHGVLGTNGIVGGGVPIATGSALGSALAGDNAVTVAFFGDGAASQGVFFECMNMAALWRLPIVFVCENNGFTEWSPTQTVTAGRIVDRAVPFGIEAVRVDGNDVLEVFAIGRTAVHTAREGRGPTLIEAVTYRIAGHLVGEDGLVAAYRSDEEIAHWREIDPIARFKRALLTQGAMTTGEIDNVESEVRAELDAALAAATVWPEPVASDAWTDVFAERDGP